MASNEENPKRGGGLQFPNCHQSEERPCFTPADNQTSSDSNYSVSCDSSTSSDSNYTSNSIKKRSSTSKWDVVYLQSLGIYYNTHFHRVPSDILDIIHQKTEMFGPLSKEQKELVNYLQNSLTFSCSITEILGVMNMIDIDTFIPEMKKDVENIRKQVPRVFVASVVEEFIKSTRLMVKYQVAHLTQDNRSDPVPKAVFVDMFKGFVKMCHLLPVPGEAWKSSMCINGKDVTTESDVVIMTESHLDKEDNEEAVSVISIVEVNGLTLYRDGKRICTREIKSRPSSSVTTILDDQRDCNGEEPAIYKRISAKVLGQHGGELLLHHGLFGRRLSKGRAFKYLPGMIVVGTEITFTVLVLNGDHVRELTTQSASKHNKAFIYYSEPRDLLKKEDRDLLLESFARLNNMS